MRWWRIDDVAVWAIKRYEAEGEVRQLARHLMTNYPLSRREVRNQARLMYWAVREIGFCPDCCQPTKPVAKGTHMYQCMSKTCRSMFMTIPNRKHANRLPNAPVGFYEGE